MVIVSSRSVMATRSADLFDNAATLTSYSNLSDMIGGIAAPPDLVIPEFSIAERGLGDYTAAPSAVDFVGNRITPDSDSHRNEDRPAVYIVIEGSRQDGGKGAVVNWWGPGVGVVVAVVTCYLIPLLPKP